MTEPLPPCPLCGKVPWLLTADDETRCDNDDCVLSDVWMRAEQWRRLATPFEILREVAGSGVVMDDERLDYVEIQIDRETWLALKRAVEPERKEGR